MSLSLFRQVSRCIQPSSYLRTGRAAAALRYNSNLVETRKNQDDEWGGIVLDKAKASTSTTIDRESIESLWKRHSQMFEKRSMRTPRDAYTGRTAVVHDGDVATAAKLLDRVLGQNYVARDWFVNRRHKQKGEERRRMRSVRWRRRFKHEVGKMVQLVQQIRRRGT